MPSTIADNAFSYPIFMAAFTDLPAPISSRIRAKIITLASTAIPMDRIIPAIPGKVKVISNSHSANTVNAEYKINARLAVKPGTRYITIIKSITSTRPMAAAFKLVEMASSPNCAPTTFECSSSNSREREPIRMVEASSSAASKLSIPSICAVPPEIASFTLGALIVSPSYTIGIAFPTLLAVASANFCAPSSVNVSSTTYSRLPIWLL